VFSAEIQLSQISTLEALAMNSFEHGAPLQPLVGLMADFLQVQ
jgi:hypothetical protein